MSRSDYRLQQNNNTTTVGLTENNSYAQGGDINRYDTSIVDENDMLNKLILERCKNIVEGKVVTAPS